ncbi:MAG: dihydroorotate dehydrogenase (quinone) [Chloroflexi bacterium]|nr:dihydroorotate dehydrogenase (quinone) [Chloroflexota bacterium]
MSYYTALLRPLLFALPPERAQGAAELLLKRHLLWKALAPFFQVSDRRLRVSAGGLEFPSPVGVAAGYDKNCEFLGSLLNLGFGYVVGGTVVSAPRAGNPRPRITRLPGDQALINALGFPSKGMEAAKRNLQRLRKRLSRPDKPIVASVAGLTVEEFLRCHAAMEPLVEAVELNVSSPNTEGIRLFQQPDPFRELLERINGQRLKPLFVKVPPYSDPWGQGQVLTLVHLARAQGVDGVTVANTRPVQAPALARGMGGLSGRPLLEDTLRMVAEVRSELGPRMAIHACGGIFTASDVLRALRAGASTVQLLTGLIYQGPSVARAIHRGLLRLMEERGCDSLQALASAPE